MPNLDQMGHCWMRDGRAKQAIGGLTSWSVDAKMVCDHCGGEFPMPLGDITWVSQVTRAFSRAHRDCCKGDKP